MAIDAILVPIAEAAIAIVSFIAEVLWRPIAASTRPIRYALSAAYRQRVQSEVGERGHLYRLGYLWWGPAALAAIAVTVGAIVYWTTTDPGSNDLCENLQWNRALECGSDLMDRVYK